MARKYPHQVVAVVTAGAGQRLVGTAEEYDVPQAEVVRLALDYGMDKAARELDRRRRAERAREARAAVGA